MTTATDRRTLAHATLVALEEAIRSRSRDRRNFYRGNIGRNWSDLAALNDIQLRALFAIRREAKRSVASERLSLRAGDHYAGMEGARAS